MLNAGLERQSANIAFKFGTLVLCTAELVATWLLGDTLFSVYFVIFLMSQELRELYKNEKKKELLLKLNYF